MSQTGKIAFTVFKVIIKQLSISLTHYLKAIHYFENTLKALTEIIFLI